MRLYTLSAILFLLCWSAALSQDRRVVGASGASFSTTGVQMDFTMGEVAINTLIGGAQIVTQGFHQPDLGALTSVTFIDRQRIELTLYPNPVSDFLNVELLSEFQGSWQLRILDITGQQVQQAVLVADGSDFKSIAVSDLPPGIYLLELASTEHRFRITEKFVKCNN